jgi:hypothetical protein
MATRLKLRSTRLHALWHYSATELLAAGVDLRTVAGRLGHGSGGATTLKVHAAWVEHADRKAADTIAQIIPTPKPRPRNPKGPYESIAADLRAQIVSGEGAVAVAVELRSVRSRQYVHDFLGRLAPHEQDRSVAEFIARISRMLAA